MTMETEEQIPRAPGTELVTDILREEMIDFQLRLSRRLGPMRTRPFMTVSSLILAGISLAIFAAEYLQDGFFDPSLIVCAVGMLILAGVFGLVFPALTRRQVARSYDNCAACGYSFFGTVRLTDTAVEKTGVDGTVSIPLERGTVFFESPQEIAFVRRGMATILLPARCLTAEFAAAARERASRLPAGSNVFLGRVQPQGCVPVPPDIPPVPVLWKQDIRYNREECIVCGQATLTRRFYRRLPLISLISTVAALTIGWGGDAESLIRYPLIFLLCVGVLTLFWLVIPYRRLSRMPEQLPARNADIHVRLDGRGVFFRTDSWIAAVPWNKLDHVIDRDSYVEMNGQGAYIFIPRRYIEDFAAFDAMITQYWHTGSKKQS